MSLREVLSKLPPRPTGRKEAYKIKNKNSRFTQPKELLEDGVDTGREEYGRDEITKSVVRKYAKTAFYREGQQRFNSDGEENADDTKS